jgi:ankyrin repeat protein
MLSTSAHRVALSSTGVNNQTTQANQHLIASNAIARSRNDVLMLDRLPRELQFQIIGYLGPADRIRLQKTSETMGALISAIEDAAHQPVDELLTKSYWKRTVQDLVDIGLVPADSPVSDLNITLRRLLLTDEVIEGLFLNQRAGVPVNLEPLLTVPEHLVPAVWPQSDTVRVYSLDLNRVARQMYQLEREDGRLKNHLLLQAVVESGVLANIRCVGEDSLFENSVRNLSNYKGPYSGVEIERRQLMTVWARQVHPVMYEARETQDAADIDKVPFPCVVACKDENILKVLLDQKVNFDVTDQLGRTPLIHATMTTEPHTLDSIEILLKHGASVNQGDTDGRTALHWAVETGSVPRVHLLLANQANINQIDGQARTPLHTYLYYIQTLRGMRESEQSQTAMVQCLLNAGVNLLQEDSEGKRPYDIAKDIVRAYKESQKSLSPPRNTVPSSVLKALRKATEAQEFQQAHPDFADQNQRNCTIS